MSSGSQPTGLPLMLTGTTTEVSLVLAGPVRDGERSLLVSAETTPLESQPWRDEASLGGLPCLVVAAALPPSSMS